MKLFDQDFMQSFWNKAKDNPRRRLNYNIHDSYNEKCQRLFNAIEPESYIEPHQHSFLEGGELLIAIRGTMAIVIFDDFGNIIQIVPFGCLKEATGFVPVVEITPGAWHTVVSLESGSVLLEVKAGPFDPNNPKVLATWAPKSGSPSAQSFHLFVERNVREFFRANQIFI
jgi:cupin fold WbuC family metalloprotein